MTRRKAQPADTIAEFGEFVDELPPKAARQRTVNIRTRRLERFAAYLRANPGRWVKYPHPLTSHRSAQTAASQIRTGRKEMFPRGEFEATVPDDSVLYVRAIRP